MDMQEIIKEFIKKGLALDFDLNVEVPTGGGHGHYSTNVAMQVAKQLGKNPKELAGEFARLLSEKDGGEVFSKIEAAGSGFINFWLSKEFLVEQFKKMAKAKEPEGPNVGRKDKVIVEYSSVNIAKEMHIGHLRATIVGDALANIYAYLGYRVVRWNYLGDWGTQFGKLIAAYKRWGSEEDVKNAPIETLVDLYVQFHGEAKNDPTLEDAGRAEFKRLEDGDRENKRLWKWFKEETMKEVGRVYKRLGVCFDVEIGEAFFEQDLGPLLKQLEKRGLIEKSEGALVIPLEEEGLTPALVRKSDGGTLYMTRDIALLNYRIKKYKPKKILHVVANQQTLYFSQILAVARKLGLAKKVEIVHVKFGMVLGVNGKKFSTREGGAISLEALLDKAVKLARQTVEKKNPDLGEEEKGQVAEMVGIGALKYSDLKENRNSDIVFDWERMLDLRGDTAPYLQYTAVRLANIVRKSGEKVSIKRARAEKLQEEIELDLAKKLLDFNDAVVLAGSQYMTSHLAKYLYELASLANQYYEKVRILEDTDEERKKARLVLVATVVRTLEKGLGLLGIQVPERI